MKYGEIWLVDFSPNVGAEIGKQRPAVIVSSDAVGALPLKVVVPVTEPTGKKQTWHTELTPTPKNGLTKKSMADCFQVKSISKKRLVRKLGVLNEEEITDIQTTLILVLGLL
jgi:mRNA interferase MazF